ncbi:MAG: DUF4136 domain-containing protein [Opitutaceae bacterium]|nr:DUF4136 domain-containing protein [Opitutaceae bacterium]
MKTKSIPALFVLGSLILGLAGCTSAPKLQFDFDKQADFTKAKTYIFKPIPQRIEGVDPGLVMRVGPAAADAVRATMSAKGYVEVSDKTKADIAVVVHGKAVPKTDVTDWGMTGGMYYGRGGWYGGYPYGGMYAGSNVTVDQYTEGTLVVEVYEVATKNMIWVGWGTARMTEKTDEQVSNVSNGIRTLLNNYPAVGQMPVAPAKK